MMGSIRFAGDLPTWVVMIAAIASAMAVLVFYLRETKSLDSPANFLIPSLRAAAVALVIVILAGPRWHSQVTVGTLGRVVFAVDQSASMSSSDTTPDGIDQELQVGSVVTRVDRVSQLLGGQRSSEGWIEQLSQTHHVEVLPFSPGNRTDIASAIASVSSSRPNAEDDSEPGNARTAVVVFSDGRNNAGSSPVDAAAMLSSAGAIVHTIGVGSMDEPPGIGISNVEHPDSVPPDGSLAGKIQLMHSKNAGQKGTLRIETADGDTVWEKQLTLGRSGTESIDFQIDVEAALQTIKADHSSGSVSRGIDRNAMILNLRAVVTSDGQDWISENNTFPFRVSAATRLRRLLILDGGSRWEMRYLKNLFERDPGWEVDTLLFGIGTDHPRLLHGNTGDGRYPDDQETMNKYDAVILGEIPAAFFDVRDSQLLQDFVTRGGGLVIVDGQYGEVAKLAATRLPDLIPVRYDESVPIKPKSFLLNALGEQQTMMDLFDDAEELNQRWRNLPVPTATNVVTPSPAAEVWAETVDVGGGRSPWLVTQLFGGGRVFYFASDQTWRWRYKVGDRFHARFWTQVMESVMQPPYSASDEYLSVGTDRLEYKSDAKPIIRARLQDASGEPVGDATVDALLVSNGQVMATVPLEVDDPQRGTYLGTYLGTNGGLSSGLPDGEYEVRIRASGFDQTALRATTPIWVGENASAEWNRISVNEQSLSSIANAGGGKYRHESSADEIFDQLETLSTGRIVESDVSLWQSFYWFWAVLGLLTTEWVLRKRSGLV